MTESYGNILVIAGVAVLVFAALAILVLFVLALAVTAKVLFKLNREMDQMPKPGTADVGEGPVSKTIKNVWTARYKIEQEPAVREDKEEQAEPEPVAERTVVHTIEPVELAEPLQAVIAVEPVTLVEPLEEVAEPIECGKCHKEIRSGFTTIAVRGGIDYMVFNCEHCGATVEVAD